MASPYLCCERGHPLMASVQGWSRTCHLTGTAFSRLEFGQMASPYLCCGRGHHLMAPVQRPTCPWTRRLGLACPAVCRAGLACRSAAGFGLACHTAAGFGFGLALPWACLPPACRFLACPLAWGPWVCQVVLAGPWACRQVSCHQHCHMASPWLKQECMIYQQVHQVHNSSISSCHWMMVGKQGWQ